MAVVGAGIVGLTTALRLADQGLSVALLERDRVAGGTTGHTTAKVTSLHGAAYHRLLADQGRDVARAYAAANQWAVAEVARLAAEVDCDWVSAPAYTYTDDPAHLEVIEQEVAAAQEAGLPVTHESGDVGLPFPVSAAVRLADQGMFHPRRYSLGIIRLLTSRGVTVSTECPVLEVNSNGLLETGQGTVRAGAVVLATQLPLLNRGGHFAATQPSTSYAMAATIEGDPPVGMYLGVGADGHSVRPLATDSIIVGGGGHVTGRDPDSHRRLDTLEQWTRGVFPVVSVTHRWSAQDYIPATRLPSVGRIPSIGVPLFAATGFAKWGMTNGTVAARIIGELVSGRPHPWPELAGLSARRAWGASPRSSVSMPRLAAGSSAIEWAGHITSSSMPYRPGELPSARSWIDGWRLIVTRRGICTWSTQPAPIWGASSDGTQRRRAGIVHVMARASPLTAASFTDRQSSPWRGWFSPMRHPPPEGRRFSAGGGLPGRDAAGGWDHRRWLFARWKLAQQILGQMGDTGDGALEGLLGVRGGLLHSAHLPHVLAGRSLDLVICGLRLEAAQRCDVATHGPRVGHLRALEATAPRAEP